MPEAIAIPRHPSATRMRSRYSGRCQSGDVRFAGEERLVNAHLQLLPSERFHQHGVRAKTERNLQAVVTLQESPSARDGEDPSFGLRFSKRADEFEAIAVRQSQIGQHDRRLGRLEMPDGLGLITGFDHHMALALQRVPEHGTEGVLILDEENLSGRGHAIQRSQPGGTPALRASSRSAWRLSSTLMRSWAARVPSGAGWWGRAR